MAETWSNEQIIADSLGRAADIEIGGSANGWRLSRWRQFVGTYSLTSLPDPLFVVHISGKRNIKTWQRDCWSERDSIPGLATIVPAGQPTSWLVDGELDVVTLSIATDRQGPRRGLEQFEQMRFAFSDPLGVALTRQVLSELYQPESAERDVYVSTLVDALRAHMLRGPMQPVEPSFPTSDFSAYRIHHVMNGVLQHPEAEHSVEAMAAQAGLTPSHFCRVFKRATGLSPHQYVMKARLERAQQMLGGTELSISQVADCLGFASQSHFTRAFRGFTGQTPSDWRRSNLH
ncbi:helix-turn-helix domain-containing protein [Novosphingobium sp.]|uniref:helix-turn-helix domain-containing protein n=1 Tax=Novosphingobium sp. TaxID=1874826 RepID=UPI0035B47770